MQPLEGNSTKFPRCVYFMVAMLELHVFRNDIILQKSRKLLREGKIRKIFATEYK